MTEHEELVMALLAERYRRTSPRPTAADHPEAARDQRRVTRAVPEPTPAAPAPARQTT